MNTNLSLPEQSGYSITIENVTVNYLVERPAMQDASSETLVYLTQHVHSHTELFVCTAGTITISSEQGDLLLGAGDVCIIPANVRHIKKKHDDQSKYFVISMNLRRRYTKNCENLYAKLNRFCCGNTIHLLREHHDICRAVMALSSNSGGSAYLPSLRLTLYLTEAAEENPSQKPHVSLSAANIDELDRASRLDYIIASHFMKELTAAQTAKWLFISERQLTRITRKQYGTTFRKAVQLKRLEVAEKMLLQTNLPVSKIAQDVGFRSACSFYRVFSEHHGKTPSEFRADAAAKS